MQNIRLSGGTVAYRSQGQGPPLILLHGWGGSSRYWLNTLENLSDTRSIYAIDLPGYGDSPPWAEIPGVQSIAALVIEFADRLGLESFDLNGHSLSATVAVYTAMQTPARVRHLVLTCASTYRNEFERRIVRQVHRVMGLWIRLRRPWMEQKRLIYRGVNKHFFYRLPADDNLLRDSFKEFLRMDLQTALVHADDAVNGDYHTVLRQVSVPTLVIGARQDAVMPGSGTSYMAKLIPNSHLKWIEQCGHLPMIEQPETYHRLLREFLLS
jgi:pimeloyl-ACP methyl ester carboxylesterase